MSGEINPVMVILNIGTAVLMLVFGFILNSMRDQMNRFGMELKQLNDAVLGKYMLREESEARWKAQDEAIHGLRNKLSEQTLKLAVLETKSHEPELTRHRRTGDK